MQHPQEQDKELATARLLTSILPKNAHTEVGLSWPSLKNLVGSPSAKEEWIVVFPVNRKLGATATQMPQSIDPVSSVTWFHGNGETLAAHKLENVKGVILLDGSWSQAKSLWWRNPWLLKLGRASIHSSQPSIYGRCRKEPNRHCVSTLEAAAEIILAVENNGELYHYLRKMMRTLVQRYRDQNKAKNLPG